MLHTCCHCTCLLASLLLCLLSYPRRHSAANIWHIEVHKIIVPYNNANSTTMQCIIPYHSRIFLCRIFFCHTKVSNGAAFSYGTRLYPNGKFAETNMVPHNTRGLLTRRLSDLGPAFEVDSTQGLVISWAFSIYECDKREWCFLMLKKKLDSFASVASVRLRETDTEKREKACRRIHTGETALTRSLMRHYINFAIFSGVMHLTCLFFCIFPRSPSVQPLNWMASLLCLGR
jgi:hypothetical protein